MSVANLAMLFAAALVGGALNAVAGGGSFFTFPMLLATGVPSIAANATSTVALWPASIASAIGYRRELATERASLLQLAVVSVLGGLLGGLLLLATPERLFDEAVPFLLLAATLAFTFGEAIRKRVATNRPMHGLALIALQLLIAIYGGYFGGGMGLMMLAAFALAGMTDIHRMNALKSALGVLINGVAVATFAVAGKVLWSQGLVMLVGSLLGGYFGAVIARRIDSKKVRPVVVVIAWAVTVTFFVKATG